MSNFITPVFITQAIPEQVNFSNGVQAVQITNLDANSNSVLYSVDGTNIKGDNDILSFDESIKKLTVSENFSYTSAYPIGVEAGWEEPTFHTGFFSQNKSNLDGASTHILVTNDLGTDSSHYGGLDMASSNSTVQYGQFGTMPNALGISSQTSSIVITPNAGSQEPTAQNGNIILTYSNGTKAHIIDNQGRLILGADNPDYSGSTYGGDDGLVNKAVCSDGVNGLKYSPLPSSLLHFVDSYSGLYAGTITSSPITLFTKANQLNVIPNKVAIMQFSFNFSVGGGSDILTLQLVNDDDSSILAQNVQHVPANSQTLSSQFNFSMPNVYSFNYSIVASILTHTINIQTNMFYSITLYEKA